MRPQTAHRIVQHGLKPFYVHGHSDLSTILTKRFSAALDVLIEKDRLYYERSQDWNYDSRTVGETYPNDELTNSKRILGELHYISDRFNATHRLQFLRYVIDKEQAK